VQGAGLLAAISIFDLFGTTLSGWLSDRFKGRALLFWYYGLRGLSLMFLPHAFGIDFYSSPIFAVFYGLDWVATVPPMVKLATDVYGKESALILFGWVVAAHQLGSAFSALGGAMLRASLGTYTVATMIAGSLCIVAAGMVLRIHKALRRVRPAAT
jgi:predicted MFS family arabinose efflux permease